MNENYMRARRQVREQPVATDPQEVAIRKLLDREFSTPFAQSEIERLRNLQLSFVIRSLQRCWEKDSPQIREGYLELLSQLTRHLIVVDEKHFAEILPQNGFLVATNHLAMPKATRFRRSELEASLKHEATGIPMDVIEHLPEEIEPFPIRLAAVAAAIGEKFSPHETSIELPQPLCDIQKHSGVIIIPSEPGGRFQRLLSDLTMLFQTETPATP